MSAKTKRFLLIFFPLLIIAGIVVFNSFERNQTPEKRDHQHVTVEINGKIIKSEVSKTPQQITKGLSGRKSLPRNTGMIFYLGERRIATFWMKDMLFPIDIIWIDDGEVVYIIESAQPPNENNIPSFTPDKPATRVLEVNAGFVKVNKVKKGDRLRIPNID